MSVVKVLDRLAFIGAHLVLAPIVDDAIDGPVAHGPHLRMIQHGAMTPTPYAGRMIVRVGLDLMLAAGILASLSRPVCSFPLVEARPVSRLMLGVITCLTVTVAAIVQQVRQIPQRQGVFDVHHYH